MECIDRQQVCDGIDDCEDASDELDCQTFCIQEFEEVFQCIHENNKTLPLECIFLSQKCDGVDNCEKGKEM